MELHLTFTHTESSPSVKAHIQDKCERLKKYFDGKLSINWTCEVDGPLQISHVNIRGKGFFYHAQASDENLYKTIDKALEKLERQLVRKKEKLTNKHHFKLTQVQF